MPINQSGKKVAEQCAACVEFAFVKSYACVAVCMCRYVCGMCVCLCESVKMIESELVLLAVFKPYAG